MTRWSRTSVRPTLPTAGEWVVVALLFVCASGLLLLPSYSADDAANSIDAWRLTRPLLSWLRSLHFWSGQAFVAASAVHLAQSFRRRAAANHRVGSIFLAALPVAVGAYLIVSGYLLRGDAGAEALRQTLVRPLASFGIGGTLIWSKGLSFFHHVGTATLIGGLAVAAMQRRVALRFSTTVVAAALLLLAAVAEPAARPSQTVGHIRLAAVYALGPGVFVRGFATVPAAEAGRWRLANGTPEGCVGCHAAVSGLGPSHDPQVIGCAACHAGERLEGDAARAHRGLIRIPGNLVDAPRTCGQSGCHESVVPRVQRSIMTTLSGVISVDRAAFGERHAEPIPSVQQLGASAADTHVRQLCSSCHLGQLKTSWGPNTEASRGGGCNACHLVYEPAAIAALKTIRPAALADPLPPLAHPRLTTNAPNANCFGCHSRSGRISLNYEGWIETDGSQAPVVGAEAKRRPLPDGRELRPMIPDVHQERGMDCIDCHNGAELMGKGTVVARKSDQQQVRCEDCHALRLRTVDPATCDPETQTLLKLRGVPLAKGDRLAVTRSGDPLPNVIVAEDGRARLVRKTTGENRELRPPAPACRRGKGHARLSCASCHTAWVPRCASCHTSYDARAEAFDHVAQSWVKGAWVESAGAMPVEAMPPTLGLQLDPHDPQHPQGVVQTFAPGMILELHRGTKAEPDDAVFRRLYALVAPHTTRREARSCVSCHADPVALGFGKGVLHFAAAGSSGQWSFWPERAPSRQDGLPADAWTGLLQERKGVVSTRSDVRPFNGDEQRRVLRVGACLTCHDGASAVMQQALDDFGAVWGRRSPRCAAPDGSK